MRDFEFKLALSLAKTQTIYQGRVRYLRVETDEGLKLQLPLTNFRAYVTETGINGRFRVRIDNYNKILELRRI